MLLLVIVLSCLFGFMDGLDKAGASSAPLETYIRTKLSREVRLCVTGQESGVSQQALAWIEGECLHLRECRACGQEWGMILQGIA